jgi:methylthioribose-1-phosphate isomerase
MLVGGKPFRTVWLDDDGWSVQIIDQTRLPHAFETLRLATLTDAAHAIRSMQVRGAPLIGVAAAYGYALALRADASDRGLAGAYETLAETRPTAINLRWALDRVRQHVSPLAPGERAAAAYALARRMADEDVEVCTSLGTNGFPLLVKAWEKKGKTGRLNILTHCNAGWLATVDRGTALAPIFHAQEAGIPLHVWVDETRPRNQGYLTAWELGQQGIPHTLLVDNAGGHVMQHGLVDLCIVGTDRTTARGDVCNKIGTYLKALAARDNDVPFYVAAPSSSIDFTVQDGVREIPIEQRDAREVHEIVGRSASGISSVRATPEGTEAANYAFDVTPARLVSGLITERGVCPATAEGLRALFPKRARH